MKTIRAIILAGFFCIIVSYLLEKAETKKLFSTTIHFKTENQSKSQIEFRELTQKKGYKIIFPQIKSLSFLDKVGAKGFAQFSLGDCRVNLSSLTQFYCEKEISPSKWLEVGTSLYKGKSLFPKNFTPKSIYLISVTVRDKIKDQSQTSQLVTSPGEVTTSYRKSRYISSTILRDSSI